MDGVVRVTASLTCDINIRSHEAYNDSQDVCKFLSSARVEYQVRTGEIATQSLVGRATSDESLIEGWVFHVPGCYRTLAVMTSQSHE